MIESSTRRPRSGTRQMLIEAAAKSLAERGYAGTTTATICSRAGVTSGALFGQFPTKVDLLAHTAEFLCEHGTAIVDESVDRLDIPPRLFDESNLRRRCTLAVDTLIEAYAAPEMQAVLELTVVARTSPELAAALAGHCPSEQDLFFDSFLQLLPELDRQPAGRAGLALMIDAMRIRSVRDASPAVVDLRDRSAGRDTDREEAIAVLTRLAGGS